MQCYQWILFVTLAALQINFSAAIRCYNGSFRHNPDLHTDGLEGRINETKCPTHANMCLKYHEHGTNETFYRCDVHEVCHTLGCGFNTDVDGNFYTLCCCQGNWCNSSQTNSKVLVFIMIIVVIATCWLHT